MNKFNLFAAIFTMLLLSFVFTSSLHAAGSSGAGDKWKVISAKGPSTCKLGSHNAAFKIKIKNTGDVKTTGQSIKITISTKYDSFTEYEEIAFTPSKTAAGKTITLSALCTNENFWTPFASTAGTKHISVKFELSGSNTSSLIEEVDIKVK